MSIFNELFDDDEDDDNESEEESDEDETPEGEDDAEDEAPKPTKKKVKTKPKTGPTKGELAKCATNTIKELGDLNGLPKTEISRRFRVAEQACKTGLPIPQEVKDEIEAKGKVSPKTVKKFLGQKAPSGPRTPEYE